MRALGVRRAATAVAVALLVTTLVSVAAVAQEPPPAEPPGPTTPADPAAGPSGPPPPPPEVAALAAAEARLAAAELQLASRTRASAGADHALRRAERAVVPHLGRVRLAVEAVGIARESVAAATVMTAAAEQVVVAAEARLEARAVDAYKYGVAHRGSLTLGAIRSAESPMEMARNLRDLESVFGHAHAGLMEAIELARRTELGQRDAERALQRAEQQLPLRQAELLAAEQLVAERRAIADRAERRWITAARAVEAARDRHAGAATAAESALAAVAAAAEQASGPLSPGGTPGGAPVPVPVAVAPEADEEPIPDLGDVDLIGRRLRALERARTLTDAQRRSRYDLVCPVAGEPTFDDDWHYPRSDMRRHEGTDLFAPRGTAVVTVAAATIAAIDPVDVGGDDLGGISVSYLTEDGSRWYAAHLATVAEGLVVGQQVPAGYPIGTVGTTGNARGTPPHLHFGWYIQGVAVNPYPSLASACER